VVGEAGALHPAIGSPRGGRVGVGDRECEGMERPERRGPPGERPERPRVAPGVQLLDPARRVPPHLGHRLVEVRARQLRGVVPALDRPPEELERVREDERGNQACREEGLAVGDLGECRRISEPVRRPGVLRADPGRQRSRELRVDRPAVPDRTCLARVEGTPRGEESTVVERAADEVPPAQDRGREERVVAKLEVRQVGAGPGDRRLHVGHGDRRAREPSARRHLSALARRQAGRRPRARAQGGYRGTRARARQGQ
jgi:hypothetical protein